jgi:hypothetical protein
LILFPSHDPVVGNAISTGLQAYLDSSKVGLNEANTAITNAQRVLVSNLEPGSRAIAILTKHAENILTALDKNLSESGYTHQEMVDKVQDTLSGLILKDYVRKGVIIHHVDKFLKGYEFSSEQAKRNITEYWNNAKAAVRGAAEEGARRVINKYGKNR